MKTVFLTLSLIMTLYASGQKVVSPTVEHPVFQVIEQMPEYPGGEWAMAKFIQTNLHYPDSSKRVGVEGRVVVGFMINEDGSLSDISIKKSVSPDVDAEAIRIVKLFPKFAPGKLHSKPVKVSYVVPIIFKLNP